MKRNIFHSNQLQEEFIKKGYVKIGLPDKGLLNELIKEIGQLNPDDNFDPVQNNVNPYSTLELHCTFLDTNIAYKQKAQEIMLRYFKPVIDDFLINYSFISGNIFIKQPGSGHLHLHQNWSVTEYPYTCLTLWIPMHDVDENNGTLQLVESSHKIVPYIPTPEQGDYFNAFTNELLNRHLTSVPVKFGEAVIFCESIIHGSPKNISLSPRVALQIAVYPSECVPVIFKLDQKKNEFLEYQIDPSFFVNHSIEAALNPTADMKVIKSVPNVNEQISYEEFLFRMENGDKQRDQLYNEDTYSVPAFAPAVVEQAPSQTLTASKGRWHWLRSVFKN